MLLKKYIIIFNKFLKKCIGSKQLLLLKVLIYLLILELYTQIFNNVSNDSLRVWYIAITQIIILSVSDVALSISKDILTNQFLYFITRPCDYLHYKISKSLGETLIKSMIIYSFCFLRLFFLKMEVPFSINKCILTYFFILFSCLLYNLILIFIGLLTYWFREIRGLIYINLTASFCFGGLILPINTYSNLLKKICYFTPYPWIIGWPATYLTTKQNTTLLSFAYLVLWFVILFVFVQFIHKFLIKNFVNKG